LLLLRFGHELEGQGVSLYVKMMLPEKATPQIDVDQGFFSFAEPIFEKSHSKELFN